MSTCKVGYVGMNRIYAQKPPPPPHRSQLSGVFKGFQGFFIIVSNLSLARLTNLHNFKTKSGLEFSLDPYEGKGQKRYLIETKVISIF